MKMRKREEALVDEYFENCRILAERERQERARAFQDSPEGRKALAEARKFDPSKYLGG